MKYFGGIEGGATHSRLIICTEDGECVANTTGLGTNHWTVGIPECARRIADMIERAKTEANIDQKTRLTSLGLSLSGCEQEATNHELEMEIRTTFPDIADNYYVCSDTMGSIFTASPIGGMVLISGTGSNALLKNPDGSSFGCGGWGHFLGDEGSAWYISRRAMKLVFDDMDNFKKCPYSVDTVWKLIQEHFNIKTRLDVLPHCYAKFDKPFYASLCKKLGDAAEQGDELSKFVFHEAGIHIATHINSLIPKVHDELVRDGDLNVVCVGSVWLSWNLLKDGFEQELKKAHLPFGLNLIRITKCIAYGACYLAADSIEFPLPRNYSNNYKVMYHINGDGQTNGNGITSNGHHHLNAEAE